MNSFKKNLPEWSLRLGLAGTYLYSGYDLFYHPTSWIWAVPQWYAWVVTSLSSLETYLRFQGVAEFVIGFLFLAWFSGKWGVRAASLFAIVESFFILVFVGINPITFRDSGLLGAALALLIMTFSDSSNEVMQSVKPN